MPVFGSALDPARCGLLRVRAELQGRAVGCRAQRLGVPQDHDQEVNAAPHRVHERSVIFNDFDLDKKQNRTNAKATNQYNNYSYYLLNKYVSVWSRFLKRVKVVPLRRCLYESFSCCVVLRVGTIGPLFWRFSPPFTSY